MACRKGCETQDCASFADCCRGIQFGSTTGENRVKEKAYDADMAAYKRLRADGDNPNTVVGAANREATMTAKKGRYDPVVL